jgi:hypothetical protein
MYHPVPAKCVVVQRKLQGDGSDRGAPGQQQLGALALDVSADGALTVGRAARGHLLTASNASVVAAMAPQGIW